MLQRSEPAGAQCEPSGLQGTPAGTGHAQPLTKENGRRHLSASCSVEENNLFAKFILGKKGSNGLKFLQEKVIV